MPTEKLSMRKIKEVLRLHHENVSNREIARRLRIGAGSVSRYLARAEAAKMLWPLSDDWTGEKIYNVLFPINRKKHSCPLPDFGKIHKELKRKGVARIKRLTNTLQTGRFTVSQRSGSSIY